MPQLISDQVTSQNYRTFVATSLLDNLEVTNFKQRWPLSTTAGAIHGT